jgi:hypothetical protein
MALAGVKKPVSDQLSAVSQENFIFREGISDCATIALSGLFGRRCQPLVITTISSNSYLLLKAES